MSLPIINLSGYLSSSIVRQRVAAQIRTICKENGFFCISHHGVPISLQNSLVQNAQKYFQLPQSIKKQSKIKFGVRGIHGYFSQGQEITSGKIDFKEGIWLGQQLFQTQLTVADKSQYQRIRNYFKQFRLLKNDVIAYFQELKILGNILIQAVAESLYLDRSFFLNTICKQHLGMLGLICYPFYQSSNDKNEWGVGQHTDYGLLTILKMTESGLEVKDLKHQWIKVDPIPDTFVINIGDILQKMTRGLYKSSPHRVRNTSGKTRYAFPYFYDPGWKAEIKELDIKVDPKELEILNKNRNYERWDQVKLQKISGTYGQYQMNKISKALPFWK